MPVVDQVVYCEECHIDTGRDVRIHHRFGAWWCPTHRDRCHIRKPEPKGPAEERIEALERQVQAQTASILKILGFVVALDEALAALEERVGFTADRDLEPLPL